MLKPRVLSLAMAAALAAVVGGVAVASAMSPQVKHVHGTLKIAMPAGGVKLTSAQLPGYVSTGTRLAALFIDGATTPAGQTASCTATNGTGTGCTITWSASLTVPGTHSFAVEIDTGTTVTPNNTVLAEGEASYTVFPGTNTLGTGGNGNPLTLNGVVNTYFYNLSGCTGSSCSGTVTPADAAAYSIFYAGTLTTPTQGNPTSGNVFDNNGGGKTNLTFASDNAAIGTVTGNAVAPFTSVSSNSLSILGVNATDAFTYTVTCAAGATGKFGLVSGGGTTGSGDVTSAELAGLSPAVSYPAGPTGLDSANLFTCTNGAASNASGSIVTN